MAFRLAARARRDLDTILRYSLEQYGRDAADRYELLLTTAMTEIGDQPLLIGSRLVRRRPGMRSYSIPRSRLHLQSGQRVRISSHQIVYRPAADDDVEILAIVGDSYPPARVRAPR